MTDKRMVLGVGVILALLLAGLGYALTQKGLDNPDQDNVQDVTGSRSTSLTPSENQSTQQGAEGVTIIFTDRGFESRTYRTKREVAVTVRNESKNTMQFSSDDHPSHTEQSELNLKALQPGEDTTFTPTESGTWGFHDHLNDRYRGMLVVTE